MLIAELISVYGFSPDIVGSSGIPVTVMCGIDSESPIMRCAGEHFSKVEEHIFKDDEESR